MMCKGMFNHLVPVKGTGFSPYIQCNMDWGFSPGGKFLAAICFPSAAKAGNQNRLSTYGLKPVPFNRIVTFNRIVIG
jgi:hypothetical protein